MVSWREWLEKTGQQGVSGRFGNRSIRRLEEVIWICRRRHCDCLDRLRVANSFPAA